MVEFMYRVCKGHVGTVASYIMRSLGSVPTWKLPSCWTSEENSNVLNKKNDNPELETFWHNR